MTSHNKPVGIALSGDHLAALLADRALTARLNASGLPFAVAGIDWVDPSIPRPDTCVSGRAVDSLAAATLADWAPRLGWLAVAAAHRDHPYSLARRIASANQQSAGRLGLVLGPRTRSALAGYDGRAAGAGLSTPFLAGPGATRDAAAAIRTLWRTVPASPQGVPVLAWRAESTGEAAAASRVADILIWPAGRPERLDAAATAAAATSGGPRLLLEVLAGGSDLAARLAGYLGDDRVAGLILRPDSSETGLREFTAHVLPELIRSGAFRAGWTGTLRQRLSLAAPELSPLAARAAVPAPAPEPALA